MNVGRLLAQTGYDTPAMRAVIDPVDPGELRLRPASRLMMKMWGAGISGMTIGNWIFIDPVFLNGDKDELSRLVVHELIHVHQFRQLGFFGFLRIYLSDYLIGRWQRLSHRDAYLAIRLEREARETQSRLIN